MSVPELDAVEHLIDLGRPDDAVGHLGVLLAAEPHDHRLHRAMARAHLRAGRPDQAAGAAGRAIALAPEDPAGHRLRALAALDLGVPGPAARHAREAVRLDPNDAWNHHVQAVALAADGQPIRAWESAEEAIRCDPHGADHLVLLGDLAGSFGADTAPGYYRAALVLDPNHAVALNNLGAARVPPTGPGAGSRHLFRAALAQDPHLKEARVNLDATTLVSSLWVAHVAMVGLAVAVASASAGVPDVAPVVTGALLAGGLALAAWHRRRSAPPMAPGRLRTVARVHVGVAVLAVLLCLLVALGDATEQGSLAPGLLVLGANLGLAAWLRTQVGAEAR